MVALTTRRSALALLAAGTTVSIAAGGLAAKPKVTAMSDIKQICERYYDAWNRKDLNAILACVDPGVAFKSPNATTTGRDAYAAAAQRFLRLVERVEVRHTFTAPEGAMAAAQGKQ